MPYNNNNNHILADKLDDVISCLISSSELSTKDAVEEVEHQLKRIDSISQELETPDLRALSHWMMLSLELDEDKVNQEKIVVLLESGCFYHWIELLSSLLREYNPALLPKLYDSLVKPSWLLKPSIPILKNFARWIDLAKVKTIIIQTKKYTTDEEIISSPKDSLPESTSDATSIQDNLQKEDDDIVDVDKLKHVFEEIDQTILEKNYDDQPIDVNEEFNKHEETKQEPLPLVISEKTTDFYDGIALKGSKNDSLSDEYLDAQTDEVSIIDIDDVSEDVINIDTEHSKDQSQSSANPITPINTEVSKVEEILIDIPSEADLLDITKSTELPISIDIDVDKSNTNQESEALLIELGDEFNTEVDDIIMTLSTISQSAEEVAPISKQLITEFDRLNNLCELFAYDEISKISSWCQDNVRQFAENPTSETNYFITSGESWSWIELTNAYLTNPEEISHLSSLSSELSKDEWFSPLEVEDLQNLLLFLRDPSNQNSPEQVKDSGIEKNSELEIATKQENNAEQEDTVLNNNKLNHTDTNNEVAVDIPIESKFKLTWEDDIHPELLEAYFEETPEIVTDVKQAMIKIANGETTPEECQTASRLAHTIKGGSAVLGITGLADYTYQLEQILDYSCNHKLPEDAHSLLIEASECLGATFEAVQNKGSEPKEFSSIFAKLCNYANSLEDDEISLDLGVPTLPDFISSKTKSTNETVREETSSNDTIEDKLEKGSVIESLEANPEKQEINTDTLDSLDDTNDFTTEVDDIVMSLVSTCNKPSDVFNHIDKYTEELQRLELLADISGYPEIAKTSQWCQTNLKQFHQYPEENKRQFIASGEAWSWIELISAVLSDPEETSHLPTLSTELMSDVWAASLPIETLQNLLLSLRVSKHSKELDISSDNTSSQVEQESFDVIIQTAQTASEMTKKGGGVLLDTKITPDTEVEVTNKDQATNEEVETPSIEDKIETETIEEILIKAKENDEHLETDALEQVEKIQEVISWDEDIHPELLAVYFQETPDQIIEVASLLHKISKNEASKDDHQLAARIAHTVKGASGVLGIKQLVDLTHKLEDILDYSVNNKLTSETSELLAESSDCLESLFEAIQNKEEIPEEFEPVLAKLTESADLIENDENAFAQDLELDEPTLPDFITKDESDKTTEAEQQDASKEKQDDMVAPLEELVELGQSRKNKIDTNEAHIRVPLRVIDNLLNLAGELVTSSTQVSDKINTTLITRNNIKEHDKRVHSMLRELTSTIDKQEKNQEIQLASLKDNGFDALEMDTYNELYSVVGLLTESILDSETIEAHLGNQLTDLGGYLRTVDQLNKELSEVILSSRMVSINTLVPRLERIVRETCRKTDKKAELIVTGNEINIDTDILNGLVDPLLHLLRNAIDHGIESPQARSDKEKDELGQICLDFKRQGNFIQMKLTDDGKGIDPEVIYQRAIDKGLITPEQEFSTQEMLKLILHAGFTTQDSVSDISGRGVGMDVVKSAIEKLKGSIEISSDIEKGTTFSIRIPLTLVTSATLLVKSSNNQVAIPSDNIEQLYYLSSDKVIHRDEAHYIKHEGKEVIIQSLAKLLGWSAKKVDYELANTLILIKANDRIHAVHIDEIIHSRDLVIKSLSPWIDGRSGVIGACHLPNGSVAPVLNLPQLLSLTEDTSAFATSTSDASSDTLEETTKKSDTPLILVVDDSLSNRKALSLIIDQTEYDVVTAVDGLDALNIMNEQHVSMVFTDLEMPRMNGLEFTQSVRAWQDNKHIPVVMITSRTTSKHKQLAEKAGVNDYLTKPVVTDTLLASIKQWIEQDSTIPA